MKKTGKKSKLVKLRVTPDEHAWLSELARGAGGLSALIRRRVFGRQSARPPVKADVLLLARIQGSLQQIARSLQDQADPVGLVALLVQLRSIELQLGQLLTRVIA